MRVASFVAAGLLAVAPLEAQIVVGVLGGTAINSDDAGAVVAIDPATGAATVLGTPIAGESLTGVAQLADGRVVASTATFKGPSRLIEIDPRTGSLIAEIGPFLNGADPVVMHDLAADPATGTLYGVAVGDGKRGAGRPGKVEGAPLPTDRNAIFRIDPATGACTYLNGPGLLVGEFLAIGFAAGDPYLWGMPANSGDRYQMDPATATILAIHYGVPGLPEGTGAMGLGEGPTPAVLLISGCCTANVGNDLLFVETVEPGPMGGLIGPVGGSRRLHDLTLVRLGPAALAIEVPILGKQGITALAVLLAVAGGCLLKRR